MTTRITRFHVGVACLLLVACKPPTAAAEIADADAVSAIDPGPSRPPWWGLTDLASFAFSVPPDLDPDEFRISPTNFPISIEDAPAGVFERGFRHASPISELTCDFEAVLMACARIEENARGQVEAVSRTAHDSGRANAIIPNLADGHARYLRCDHDSAGRVVDLQLQVRASQSCNWQVRSTRYEYDLHGSLVRTIETSNNGPFRGSEDVGHNEEAVNTLFTVHYEAERPMRRIEHRGNIGYRVMTYDWNGDRLTQINRYNERGQWTYSYSYLWEGNHVGHATFTPDMKSHQPILARHQIHERRSADDYVIVYSKLYDDPPHRWDNSIEADVETSLEYVGEVLVARNRYTLIEGKRRPLSVEQLLPDVEGLVMVERWDWTQSDRVIVERPDGRTIYLLDCSGEPAFESYIDPQCPPPLPIR